MQPLKILDLGASYGMSTHHVFRPWVTEGLATVIRPSWAEGLNYISSADLICFGGGADIHPSLYNSRDVASHVGKEPSGRDRIELRAFELAQKYKKPTFGICRGAQLVCALSGGKLIQDVRGHIGEHDIIADDGRSFAMTSIHHQMMYITPNIASSSKLLAWCNPRSPAYSHDIEDFVVPTVEPEIVLFENTRALGVQGHPEAMDPNHRTVAYVRRLISQYLLNSLVER